MKKIVLILMVVLCFAISAEARQHDCLWVWSTDVAGADGDPTDHVYCKDEYSDNYYRVGTTHMENTFGAKSIQITWDTSNAAVAVSSLITLATGQTDATLCTNANSLDLYVLAGDARQLSTGGVYYHTEASLADGDANTFMLTSPAAFQLQVKDNNESGAGCMVVWTSVLW